MADFTAAEFFAGIGLMRLGLEGAGIETCWANDIEPAKRELYAANFGAEHFVLGDIRDVAGADIPPCDLATASFPCTDLSLAGNRKGLGQAAAPRGEDGGSSMFWEFARVIGEMRTRRPRAVLLENVLGFASSHGGRDLREAVHRLNDLGYSCDLLTADARFFVPQSRPRMFIVGVQEIPQGLDVDAFDERPAWVQAFREANPRAQLHAFRLPSLPHGPATLDGVVDPDDAKEVEWWDDDRVARFRASLSPLQSQRLAALESGFITSWRTAYRRTRAGKAVWEIRADGIAGCLRTARGGSSKQALVCAGHGAVRVRWMTPREYARLMGAPDFKLAARRNQALFGFGDAVCVPVIAWLCRSYIAPTLAAAPALAAAA